MNVKAVIAKARMGETLSVAELVCLVETVERQERMLSKIFAEACPPDEPPGCPYNVHDHRDCKWCWDHWLAEKAGEEER